MYSNPKLRDWAIVSLKYGIKPDVTRLDMCIREEEDTPKHLKEVRLKIGKDKRQNDLLEKIALRNRTRFCFKIERKRGKQSSKIIQLLADRLHLSVKRIEDIVYSDFESIPTDDEDIIRISENSMTVDQYIDDAIETNDYNLSDNSDS